MAALKDELQVDQALLLRHELQRPLTYLVSCLDWMRVELQRYEGDAAFDPIRRWVEQACASAEHIAEVVADAEPLERQPMRASSDLSALVRSSLRVVETEMDRRARVSLALEEDVIVQLEEGRARRLLLNLIVNAMVMLPAGEGERPTLSLTLQGTGRYAILELHHSGSLPFEAQLASVGGTYFTTDGLNLGWAICKRIVHSCMGSLAIDREDGGTRVRVVIPVAPR
jgi:C4-dicarboxylate-specific signal transduction histidine kinase